MKKYSAIICIIMILTVPWESVLGDTDSGRDIVYTYVGPIANVCFNYIWQNEYTYDTGSYREETSYAGFGFAGGAIFAIYSKQFYGDATFQYMYNINDGESLYHFHYTTSGRYIFTISDLFQVTAGLGLYFESEPSNETYNGSGGGQLPVGLILNTSFDTKLFMDIYLRYGFFGIGDKSTKLSTGILLGFIFKVGRI